ncbi:Peptidase U62 modulator of DNA gyrase [Elusimicrobium minutum Pei191]|uniref:Peptidase U62 modulator of DNA gyrase n=1 Tax=Elusimicrobium minutum (strain Pei191) TaxID=445932 RepID=B2KAR7_ELUMP|nr:TldD/PmbA family protein [Elusimicrobium minutum]ACC97613.1 Peptidase U62 modulator of DNA gyrase [Elusimicrobium minutum Pei191]
MKKTLFLLILCIPAAAFSQDILLNSMRGELDRSFKVLKKQSPPVYYMSYYAEDSEKYIISASLGDIVIDNTLRSRGLNADVRVGSRKLDNTHEFKGSYDNALALQTYSMPLEDNEKAIKNVIWRATEEAVKMEQDRFLKVKTNAAVKTKSEDDSADFSKPVKKVDFYEPVKPQLIDTKAISEKVKELSSLMKGHDFILNSEVTFSSNVTNRYLVTSEGSNIVEGNALVRLFYNISTRNEDGMVLNVSNSYDGFNVGDLAGKDIIAADIKRDIEILKKLRNAPVVEPFTGPVILKNKASGVFFHEILGHRVEGHRQKSESFGQTFTKKINEQIVSPVISVYDDPTLSHFNGTPLRGYYKYDDDGVAAKKAVVIEDGVLKGFFMGRSPIKNFEESNGHGRKALGRRTVARMGNTIVKAKDPVSFEELKQKLKEEIKRQNKPYGLIIEDTSGGLTAIDRYAPQSFKVDISLVYKVYPDDREDELVRGVSVVGTPLLSFNKILAAADDDGVFNGTCGAESGWVPVSAVSPSILIGELEVEKIAKDSYSLPILKNPTGGKN